MMRTPFSSRLHRASAVFALVSAFAAPAFAAPASTCGGKNLLDGLKTSDPAAYEQVRKAADAVENGKAVLWKVSHSETPDRPASYLFGTMHVTDDRVIAMSPKINKAFGTARRIALEVEDTSPQRLLEAMSSFGDKVLLPEGKRLDKLLQPAETAKLSAMLHKTGVPPTVALRLQPWLAYLLMSYTDCERSRITGGKLPLDGELARLGEDRGIGVIGLETVETQFLALADIPEDDQLAILKSGLAMRDKVTDLTETMIQLYLRRDIGAMWPIQVAIAKAAGLQQTVLDAFERSLLVERNLKMRDRAVAHMAFGGVFVAVGAAHLPGKSGLVTLLRDAGYTVVPVE
jgi:uncharacterized protein